MNADQTMALYETRRKIAALNGNEVAEQHWTERIIRVSDQIEAARQRAQHCATFDVLKGHPDHSGASHA